MVTRNLWTPLSDAQTRVFADARQQFDLYRAAHRRMAEFPGWMFWKKYPSGRSYLVHAYDRTGKGTTLGGASAENDAKLLAFKTQQADAKLRFKMARDKVAEQARYCKAARINRVPRLVAAIVRAFTEQATAFQSFVIGSCALYVYEGLYDVQFSASVLEPARLTLVLYFSDSKLPTQEKSTGDKALVPIEILRSIDDSFTEYGEVISNHAGFAVEILELIDANARTHLNAIEGTAPVVLMGIDPAAFTEVVIDQDGLPLEMRAPDPRLFAANKRWLSEQESRSPEERERDGLQSDAVAAVMRSPAVSVGALPKLLDSPNSARLGSILRELDLARK